jgi:hypothetical protein
MFERNPKESFDLWGVEIDGDDPREARRFDETGD